MNQASLASSPMSPGRRRPPNVVSEFERNSNINKGSGGQSPLVSTFSRRKRLDGNVSDSKPSLKLKTRDHSRLTRNGRVTDTNNVTLRMKKSQMTSNPSSSPSPARLRRVNTDTNLRMQKGFMSSTSPALSTSRTSCTSGRKCCHVSDSDSGLRIRDRLSPLALSPLSPYVRRRTTTCGHVSDSESNSMMNRGSLSPLALSPLSPYVRTTCGHVSD